MDWTSDFYSLADQLSKDLRNDLLHSAVHSNSHSFSMYSLKSGRVRSFYHGIWKNKNKELTKTTVDPTSMTVAIHKVGHYCKRTCLSGVNEPEIIQEWRREMLLLASMCANANKIIFLILMSTTAIRMCRRKGPPGPLCTWGRSTVQLCSRQAEPQQQCQWGSGQDWG